MLPKSSLSSANNNDPDNNNNNVPSSSQGQFSPKCLYCGKRLQETEIAVIWSSSSRTPALSKYYVCSKCNEQNRVTLCPLCHNWPVAVNDKPVINAEPDPVQKSRLICCSCYDKIVVSSDTGNTSTLCVYCKKAMAGVPGPLLKLGEKKVPLCQECQQQRKVTLCQACKQVIVVVGREPCEGAVKSVKQGITQWFCGEDRVNTPPIECACCYQLLMKEGKWLVNYEPVDLGGIYLCQDCQQLKQFKCNVCDYRVTGIEMPSGRLKILQGQRNPYSGLLVCSGCREKSEQLNALCPICRTHCVAYYGLAGKDAFVREPGGQWADKILCRCAFCNSKGLVMDLEEQAYPLLDKVFGWFQENAVPGFKLEKKPALSLADQMTLAAYHKEGELLFGYCKKEKSADGQYQICILYALTPVTFMYVLAHEMTHALCLQYQISWKEQPNGEGLRETEEGFCELVAYRFLQWLSQNGPDKYEVLSRMVAIADENRVDAYGNGFKTLYEQWNATSNNNNNSSNNNSNNQRAFFEAIGFRLPHNN